jgi:hypothetical protein
MIGSIYQIQNTSLNTDEYAISTENGVRFIRLYKDHKIK